jgi:hypothetical protein
MVQQSVDQGAVCIARARDAPTKPAWLIHHDNFLVFEEDV